MPIKDYLIKKSKLSNNNNNCEFGDSSFDTYDYIYLESIKDVESLSLAEKQAVASDYALAVGEMNNKKNNNKCEYWLRSSYSNDFCRTINISGNNSNSYIDIKQRGICPCLQFNLQDLKTNKKSNSIGEFKFKISEIKSGLKTLYHTIEFDNLVYPQTKVSDKMEEKYQSGLLKITGKSYQGKLENLQSSRNIEYEYNGERYVRIKTIERIYGDIDYGDVILQEFTEIEKFHWFKVEPIKWIIRNWNDLPKSINPNGKGTANSIIVRSEKAILSGLPFYTNTKDENCGLWQNSTLRGALNGINVKNINKNGNLQFTAPNGGNFIGKGFIDDMNRDFVFERDYITEKTKKEAEKAQKDVDEIFYKALKDSGFDMYL